MLLLGQKYSCTNSPLPLTILPFLWTKTCYLSTFPNSKILLGIRMRSVEPRIDNKKWDKRRKTWCQPKNIVSTFFTVFINPSSPLIVSSIGRRYTRVEAYTPSLRKQCVGHAFLSVTISHVILGLRVWRAKYGIRKYIRTYIDTSYLRRGALKALGNHCNLYNTIAAIAFPLETTGIPFR